MVGDALGRSVRAVRGAERIVDVDIRELGEALREGRIVGFLPGVEADVLQQEDVATC